MSTIVGPNACGTGANVDDGGDSEWIHTTYIQVNDTNWAETSPGLGASHPYSQSLRAENFGFSIPAGASITDISFSYIRKKGATGNIFEHHFRMIDSNGDPTGTELADTGTLWSSSGETITRHGDSAYWGLTLTPTLVNDADFGLEIAAHGTSSALYVAYVQYVSCTVTYVIMTKVLQASFRGMGNGMFRRMR